MHQSAGGRTTQVGAPGFAALRPEERLWPQKGLQVSLPFVNGSRHIWLVDQIDLKSATLHRCDMVATAAALRQLEFKSSV